MDGASQRLLQFVPPRCHRRCGPLGNLAKASGRSPSTDPDHRCLRREAHVGGSPTPLSLSDLQLHLARWNLVHRRRCCCVVVLRIVLVQSWQIIFLADGEPVRQINACLSSRRAGFRSALCVCRSIGGRGLPCADRGCVIGESRRGMLFSFELLRVIIITSKGSGPATYRWDLEPLILAPFPAMQIASPRVFFS